MQSAVNDQRRKTEAEFHDQQAASLDLDHILVDESFTSVTAVENQHILQKFGDVRGKRILDYGSGMSEGGIYLAKQGAHVVATDVSSGMLDAAQRLAKRHGVEIETRVVEGDRIPGGDDEFDLIYGNGVLHHAPLDTAIPELARILKPNGTGCFIEPLPYNPVINIYRRIAKDVRTPDEQPLTFEQVDQLKNNFGSVNHEEFWLSTLSVFLRFYFWDRVNPNHERYWKKIYTDAPRLERMFRPLYALDQRLLKALPPLGKLCWNTVITVSNPLKRRA
jgi:SAM-dependent methyltransferase